MIVFASLVSIEAFYCWRRRNQEAGIGKQGKTRNRATKTDLEARAFAEDNFGMELTGYFENGVIVLDGGTPLPDGTRVRISARVPDYPLFQSHPGPRIPIPSPLVPSDHPGSIYHTPEEIDEFLNDDILPVRDEDVVPIPFPLIRTGEPGSLRLTNKMIDEILSEEDASP